ncbi:MAG TPA: glycosyltransferase [Terriglobales bacterium]|jgi:glycosyltransferase involved in cell wall biosynthesis|nr:glycosyltransferase [Terriglobales bacterium]
MAAGTTLPGSVQVSIIVPARDEEPSLGACLESLISQTGVTFEIIVVDDGSTDRTLKIAQSFGVRVIHPEPLPAGWSGKVNAVVAGAAAARGTWLLFTDADTIHLPGSLERAVAEANGLKAELLSYSPQQKVVTFWEKAVMPVVFAELAAKFRPAEVSDPRSPAAAANGQYMLVTREAYDAVGGFGSVATTLLEDVAMARAVKASGRKIFFRYAPDAVSARMYRSFEEIRDGWTKNLALLFPATVRLANLRRLEFLLIAGGAILSVVEAVRGRTYLSAFAFAVAALLYGLFLKRIRRAHFSWEANLFSIFGLPVFSYLLLRSPLFHDSGKVSWKGRYYGGTAQLEAPVGESEDIATSQL